MCSEQTKTDLALSMQTYCKSVFNSYNRNRTNTGDAEIIAAGYTYMYETNVWRVITCQTGRMTIHNDNIIICPDVVQLLNYAKKLGIVDITFDIKKNKICLIESSYFSNTQKTTCVPCFL